MATIVLALLALTTTAFAQDECEDGLKPIYIDFHNRNVDANDQNVQYGLFIGVGTPFQNQSLWPSITHNETTFSGPDLCENSDNSRCREQTHGTYIPEDSETFVDISQSDFRDQFLLDETATDPAAVALTGNDTLNLYTHYFDPSPATATHIDNFPVSQLTNFSSSSSPWFGPSGLLGLGPSAPVLTRLFDANLISTRSFGLYLGTAYPRAGGAINGSLTLGGYDSGRLTGPAHTFDFATDYDVLRGETPFRVTISSITLTTSSSSSPNDTIPLLAGDSIPAYLTTTQHSMTFPPSIIDTFIDATSATTEPNSFSEPSLHLPSSNSAPDYTLNITLSSGLSIVIPPEEMRNASNATPLSTGPASSNSTSNSADSSPPALLGAAFLQHLYLTAQYTSRPQFHLNLAAPHGPYVLPQPLCASTVPEEGDPVPNKLSAWERNGIIGAVLGGVIGGLGLGFAVFWCWGRMRAGAQDGVGEGKRWADAEDEEVRGWVGVGRRFRRGRGKGKGKGKAYTAGYVDVEGKSLSEGSNSDDGRDGYDLQQFSPVAIPAAYGERPDPAAPSSATGITTPPPSVPFDFTSGAREPLSPSTYDLGRRGDSSDALGSGWEEVVIGQAVSTPPPLQVQVHTPPLAAAERGRHGDAATLRSISPVSPIEPGLFAADDGASGGSGGGSWMQLYYGKGAGGGSGSGSGSAAGSGEWGFTGEARTAVRIKVPPRKAVGAGKGR